MYFPNVIAATVAKSALQRRTSTLANTVCAALQVNVQFQYKMLQSTVDLLLKTVLLYNNRICIIDRLLFKTITLLIAEFSVKFNRVP